MPTLSITNRQRTIPVDLARLRRLGELALPDCFAQPGTDADIPPDLDQIEVSILSPRAMAEVHRRFLNLPGPTDVITFPYGEILICAAVAARQAAEWGTAPDDELALYLIHGLLHLNGFDDLSPAPARRMRNRQSKILKAALARL